MDGSLKKKGEGEARESVEGKHEDILACVAMDILVGN